MTTDPRDAEIARLTAANNALKGSLTVLDEGYRRVEAERDAAVERAAAREAWAAECLLENECLTAERDAALAQVAVLKEVLENGPDLGSSGGREPALQNLIYRHYLPHMTDKAALEVTERYIHALTSTDALAALSRRDAQMRAEGRKEGLREAAKICTRGDDRAAILAAAEKEAPHG